VAYRAGNNRTELENLRIKSGHWEYTAVLHKNLAAQWWGLDLDQWDELSQDAKAQMLATYEVNNEMSAYDRQKSEKRMKESQHAKGRR
jgi:hypothetical protein